METYFIRHTEQLDINEETFNELIKKNLIAIHFPYKKSQNEKNDSESIDPDDYHLSNNKESIRTFCQLAKEGGYVCAEYRRIAGATVGKVTPNTEIGFLKGEWGERSGQQGRTAILKILPLKQIQHIAADRYLTISSGRPRQGTIKIWRNIGKRIENLVENKPIEPILQNLSPSQQEVLCSEFLRNNLDQSKLLPKTESLLLPVGRTLIDIDIVGVDDNGDLVYAQVTYSKRRNAKNKLENLKKYSSKRNSVVLFCDCSIPEIIDDIIIYPLRVVFEKYSQSEAGGKWIKNIFR